jgi:hypothetical protein
MTALGCDRCEFGWRTVVEANAERQFPRPDGIDDPSRTPEERDALERIWKGRLAGAKNSVYPCKVCNAVMFFRWAAGHLDSNHDRSGCSECLDARNGRSGKKEFKPTTEHPPPTDRVRADTGDRF